MLWLLWCATRLQCTLLIQTDGDIWLLALRSGRCYSTSWQYKGYLKKGQDLRRRIIYSSVSLIRHAIVRSKKPYRTDTRYYTCTRRWFVCLHRHANASTVWLSTISAFWWVCGSSTPILTSESCMFFCFVALELKWTQGLEFMHKHNIAHRSVKRHCTKWC